MADSVTVGVRVRPLNDRELSGDNPHIAWTIHDNELHRSHTGPTTLPSHTFRYDSVFNPSSTNQNVYSSLAAPVIDSALGGFNATVFAYGQTSSGKTHSMLGSEHDPGITPLAIRHVLESASSSRTRNFLIRAVYVEIYNDRIRDLLKPSSSDLAVREDKAGRVFVDAEEVLVESFGDAMRVLEKGQAARHVGETNMNARSSRSHTVFTLHIESKAANGLDVSFRASSLNLVDLAGSERLKSTGAEGARQKEGAHINQSLLVLGTIINRLSAAGTDASKIGHLPYRDSKLTRLLRPALGGNAKLAILCAITPAAAHIEETLSTLKFAERAKKVTTNATRNEVVDYRAKYKEAITEVEVLRERYASVQEELASFRENGVMLDGKASMQDGAAAAAAASAADAATQKAIEASKDLRAARDEIAYVKAHAEEVETENEQLRARLRVQAGDFAKLRARAIELRSIARSSRSGEKAVRRTLGQTFRKLEEAREQLDISRKKGAHVLIAENHLEELSSKLRVFLPNSEKGGEPGLIAPEVGETGETDEGSPAGKDGVRRESSESDKLSLNLSTDGTWGRRAKRKPRPLPEDMVADIDDSETETIATGTLDDDDLGDVDDVESIDEPSNGTDVSMGVGEAREGATSGNSGDKSKKKSKGWRAFRSFYGYAERGVYDKMIGGHKVPSPATTRLAS